MTASRETSERAGSWPRRRPAADRRGVLLLVVLSMLSLFMMLGVAYLVTATRARETARAFSRLTFGGDTARVPAPHLLDAILLEVVRGPVVITNYPALTQSGTFESLLADKYGSGAGSAALSGTLAVITGTGPVITVAGTLSSGSARPTDFVGRVLTITAAGRPVTSHRILRASNASNTNVTGNAFTLALDQPSTGRPSMTPANGSRFLVNGREFSGPASASPLTQPSNESWDAFDSHNLYLARLESSTASVSQSSVLRGSFLQPVGALGFLLSTTAANVSGTWSFTPSGTSATVRLVTGTADFDNDLISDAADNDNDGVVDGVFLDYGLPTMTDAAGNVVTLRASVLVVDLDSRLNVNAHDSLARLLYTGTTPAGGLTTGSGALLLSASHGGWSTARASGTLTVSDLTGTLPLGSGYGPAEVNGRHVFLTLNGTGDNPTVFVMAGGSSSRLSGTRSADSRFSANAPTLRLDSLHGRYGESTSGSWGISGTGSLLTDGTLPFGRPGQPLLDDAASRITDRRTVATGTMNYGIPPFWWVDVNGPLTGTNFNWAISGTVAGVVQPLPRTVFNSPPDLHGRMKATTVPAAAIQGTGTAVAPGLIFAKADWPTAASGTISVVNESQDDPYETRLDTRQGFGGRLRMSGSIADDPFTPAELEPVLRPYDTDTNRLSPRLAAMLGTQAEAMRFRITTESWDTTAVTGSAAIVLFGTPGVGNGWLQSSSTTAALSGTSAVTGLLGGEIARGERFDLNRALEGDAPATYSGTAPYYLQRQAYCKDLYTLLVALSGTSASNPTFAQWAANVVDFRDGDSMMTPFEYDTNPVNGWNVDGDATTTAGESDRAVAFGAERPEIMITEALAWENVLTDGSTGNPLPSGTAGGIMITLHRPWMSRAYGSGSTSFVDAETCDVQLDSVGAGAPLPSNWIDLGRKSGGGTFNDTSGTTYPIWRIRIVSGTQAAYLRFDTGTTTTGTNNASGWPEYGLTAITGVTSGSAKPKLPPDSSLSFVSGTGFVRSGSSSTISLASQSCLTGTLPLVTQQPIPLVSGSSPITGQSSPFAVQSGTDAGIEVFRVPGGPSGRLAFIHLERLDNPASNATAGTWSQNSITTATTTVPMYRIVDSTTITVVNTGSGSPYVTTPSMPLAYGIRSTDLSGTSFWKQQVISGSTTPRPFGTPLASGSTCWFPWPNRPFVSAAELLLVPQGDATEILSNYSRPRPSAQGGVGVPGVPVPLDLLLDAVHVPTRFAGIHATATGVSFPQTGIDTTVTPVNQLSSFREPGRVNLNTVTGSQVWNAVVAGPLSDPVVSHTASTIRSSAAQNMVALLALSGGSSGIIVSDTHATLSAASLNPHHAIYTATRLANTVTPRSNVFGVWITLRESVAGDPDSVRFRRAFYIVDRSIPVGFEQGRDLNVWDCVRLRRIIE